MTCKIHTTVKFLIVAAALIRVKILILQCPMRLLLEVLCEKLNHARLSLRGELPVKPGMQIHIRPWRQQLCKGDCKSACH